MAVCVFVSVDCSVSGETGDTDLREKWDRLVTNGIYFNPGHFLIRFNFSTFWVIKSDLEIKSPGFVPFGGKSELLLGQIRPPCALL